METEDDIARSHARLEGRCGLRFASAVKSQQSAGGEETAKKKISIRQSRSASSNRLNGRLPLRCTRRVPAGVRSDETRIGSHSAHHRETRWMQGDREETRRATASRGSLPVRAPLSLLHSTPRGSGPSPRSLQPPRGSQLGRKEDQTSDRRHTRCTSRGNETDDRRHVSCAPLTCRRVARPIDGSPRHARQTRTRSAGARVPKETAR